MEVAVRAIRANRSMSNKTGLRDVTQGHFLNSFNSQSLFLLEWAHTDLLFTVSYIYYILQMTNDSFFTNTYVP